MEACERSLRRLGTDRLDLYLLHWLGRTPLEDTLAAFTELIDALRHDGVNAIPRADTPAHVTENHAALDLQLDADDLAALDRASFFPPPAARPAAGDPVSGRSRPATAGRHGL